MLLGRLWLKDAKVTHDWGNNVIIVQGNGIIKTMSINKKLGAKTKRPQIFVCYDLLKGLIDEEKDLILEIEPKLFSICTIIILDEKISLLSIKVLKIKISEKSNPKQKTSNQGAIEVVPSIRKLEDFYVKPKRSLEDKIQKPIIIIAKLI
jgi:hypothetical protein